MWRTLPKADSRTIRWSKRSLLHATKERAPVVAICAALEAQIADLGDEDKRVFLADLGLDEPGLNRLIRAGYELLGLQTFFTAGPKEARAWTVRVGATAPQAAGEIHTDFERGFIRAEVIPFADYVACKGEVRAREAGKMRLEGKEYVVTRRRRHVLPLQRLSSNGTKGKVEGKGPPFPSRRSSTTQENRRVPRWRRAIFL